MNGAEILFVTLAGLCFGSFITLASYRLPRGQGIIFGASRCTECGTSLRAPDLFPVLSWLCLRGRCRHCRTPVSWRYPVIELVTALLFLLIYRNYGLTPHAKVLTLATVALMVMVVVDFEHYIIPDEVHVALLVLAVLWRIPSGNDIYHLNIWNNLFYIGCGIACGFTFGCALRYGYYAVRRRHGLGFGDVKFLGVAGAWLGIMEFVPFLFFSGLCGIAVGLFWRGCGKGRKFPFGPALAASLFLCVVFPEVPNAFWNLQARIYH